MATTTYDISSDGAGDDTTRGGSFTDRLRSIRLGSSAGRLGLLVVAVGLLAIGLGWNGMAGSGGEVNHVPNLSAQLPWLVSGGVLGLALVVFGGALLIAHNAREDRMHLEAKLGEILDALATAPAASASAAASAPRATSVGPSQATTARSVQRGLFLAGATVFHRSDCRLVEGREDLSAITRSEATKSGLKPCRICKPAAS